MISKEGKVVFEKLSTDIREQITTACQEAKLSDDDKMEIIEDLGVSLEELREEVEDAQGEDEDEAEDDEEEEKE